MTPPAMHASPAAIWAATIAGELLRQGVDRIVIAPGSRSTPLALAFAAGGRFRIFSLIDERGAAYFALGLGLEDGRPAAVLCTSGTAAANFLPAVVEAAEAEVPLILLTADRPPELRATGANQTIDQVRIFAPYARFSRDLLPPQADPTTLQLRYLRTTVDRAVHTARFPVPGPVHLNLPFRKPLEPRPGEPQPDFPAPGRPLTHLSSPSTTPVDFDIDWPARGLILAGPRCPEGEFPEALAALAQATGYPVIADALSGLRFGPWTDLFTPLNPLVCREFAAASLAEPELVLQFGAVPTANAALDMLERLQDGVRRVSVQLHGTWRDPAHSLTDLLHADPAAFCRATAARFDRPVADPAWTAVLERSERAYWAAVDRAAAEADFEGLILPDVVAGLKDGDLLFVASSLPVRHLDEFVRPATRRIRTFGNRGASGIDGTISTALGVAASAGKRLTLVLGDLAFYHDLNGLLALRRCGLQATIVVIHNDGGGIFRRLPVADIEPPFTDLFLTPHGLDFEPAARMFGAEFLRADDRPGRLAALRADPGGQAAVIQVRTDSAWHERVRQQILAQHITPPPSIEKEGHP